MRPIPRRNFLHDALNDTNSLGIPGQNNSQIGSNAAIGVVIPTTPNSTLHQHQNQLNEHLLQHSATASTLTPNSGNHHQSSQRRINHSPDFGAAEAASLLSMRVPDGAPQQHLKHQQASSSTSANNLLQPVSRVNANGSNANAAGLNVEERLNQIQDCIRITSTLINSFHTDKVCVCIDFVLIC